MTDGSPSKHPTGNKLVWTIMVVAAAVVLVLVPIFLWIAYASRNTQFVVSPQSFQVTGSMYGQIIPREHLLVSQARLVNLNAETNLAPARRTHGVGLPGYSEGWFLLADGRRALVFLTQRSQAVLIPTTQDYVVLISPVRPEMLLAAVQAPSRATQTFAISPSPTSPVILLLLAVLLPLVGLIPILALFRYAARYGRTVPVPLGPDVIYADRLVEITHDSILFTIYYFPGGKKRVMFRDIESIRPFPLTELGGKWRIWGTGDLRTWWPADWDRPSRDVAYLLVRRNKRIRIAFTVEDPPQVEAILRKHGLLREV